MQPTFPIGNPREENWLCAAADNKVVRTFPALAIASLPLIRYLLRFGWVDTAAVPGRLDRVAREPELISGTTRD